MPAAIELDREPIKALFVQGVTIAELARRFQVNVNTLNNWARKDKWGEIRESLRGEITKACVAVAKSGLDAANERVRSKLAQDIEKTLESIPKQSKGLDAFVQRETGLAKLTDRAAKVFAWGSDNVTVMFGVQMISDALPEPAPAIEVQEVKADLPCGIEVPEVDTGTHGTPPQEKTDIASA